jgi:hydroxyethylthiazole kinase
MPAAENLVAADAVLEGALSAIDALRGKGALVHCITNTVAQNFTANVLLACGATPSMTVAREEARHFTSSADAVLVNLGTLDEDRVAAIRQAVLLSADEGKPLVLDPVMCHISPPRLALAREVAAAGPSIIRANAAEAEALGGLPAATVLARTGAVDRVEVGAEVVTIANGHPFMSRVVAVGCAQGALMAALASVAESPRDAALAALVWFGVAGEHAATKAKGPGTFQPLFLDALYTLSTSQISHAARMK